MLITRGRGAYANLLASLGASGLVQPSGRLSPSTGVFTPTAAVSAAGTVYYVPGGRGNVVPLYNGAAWNLYRFTELSNVLANSATGSAGPAAAQALGAYDLFVWSNAGVLTLTRGPVWTYTASVAVTLATPGVVTWAAHGLTTGMVVRFGGTAVPTGLSAATDYYITVVDANSFKVSTTMANLVALTYVATSSTGTSVTSTCFGFSRGTGAGTTELTLQDGLRVNANAITNGPGAKAGLYVGSIYTDAGGATVTYDPGSAAALGGTAKFNLWNAYNRVQGHANVRDSNAAYTYTTATRRPADNSAANSIQMIRGLQEDHIKVSYTGLGSTAAALSAFMTVTLGLDNPLARVATTAFQSSVGQIDAPAAVITQGVLLSSVGGDPGLGIRVIYAQETGDGTNANTFNTSQSQLEADVLW